MNISSPPLRVITVGHVDHGKSTLLGRLLHDTDSLSEEQVAAVKAASAAEGVPLEYAFLLDAFLEEQTQNITIDTTQLPFRTATRSYVLIDAPGHEEFLKNMVTGASAASAAILLVDSVEGVRQQTRRHLELLPLLGIHQVIVAINKMDLVAYSKDVFEEMSRNIQKLFQECRCSLSQLQIVPIAARLGENIASHSQLMPWYEGFTILEALDYLVAPPSLKGEPLRFVVQDIYRFDERRLIVGRVESGTLRVGEEIIFWPEGKKSRIATIEEWGASIPPIIAESGASVAITLETPLFVERGHVGSDCLETRDTLLKQVYPSVGREITGYLFWLDKDPLKLHEPIFLKIGTQSVMASLVAMSPMEGHTALSLSTESSSWISQHDVSKVTFHLKSPIAYDAYEQLPFTGRFVIVAQGRLSGGGIILKPQDSLFSKKKVTSDHLTWSYSAIDREARRKQFGHPGLVLWFTGLSGSGKSTVARGLEEVLHCRGMAVTVLDGDNLRHGLCADLGFSEEDRSENIRRAGEVAKLFAEAGLIVIGSFISPFQRDRDLLRASCARDGIPFLEIFIDAPLDVCEVRDPRGLYVKARRGEISDFTGVTSPYEPPLSPDVHLSTEGSSVEDTVAMLDSFVVQWIKD